MFSIFYLHEIRECEIEVCLTQQNEKALGSRWQRDKGMVVFSASSPRHPVTEVDLFLEPPFEFESAWQRSVQMELSPQLHARFISLSDLRAMKRAAARPQDLLDLAALARVHPEEHP